MTGNERCGNVREWFQNGNRARKGASLERARSRSWRDQDFAAPICGIFAGNLLSVSLNRRCGSVIPPRRLQKKRGHGPDHEATRKHCGEVTLFCQDPPPASRNQHASRPLVIATTGECCALMLPLTPALSNSRP